MSLFSSVIKGKGVQTAFCSLCSNTAGPARLLSSTARRTITDEQLKSNRSVGQARLQQEAAARQQFRRQKVGELTGVLKTVEIEGVAENSIMAQSMFMLQARLPWHLH